MRKILVVEDNEMNREMLNAILSEEYEVLEAENGAEGLALLEENYQDLSVILLDLQMPVMNGFEFLERVHGDALLSAVPVIVMTADENADSEVRCMELGAVEFLEKPYNPVVMFGRIRNIIRMREAAADIISIEYDELTGLYTKQAFQHYAEKMLRENPDEKYTAFISDIREFKLINSVYGEAKGNEILLRIADKLKKDAKAGNGIAGHYGADRFLGLFPAQVVPSVETIEQDVRECTEIAGVDHIRIKIGVYENVDRDLKISTICDRASSALDLIKRSYDRNVGTYDEPAATRYREEQKMENDFDEAIRNGEFVPWFQPKIDPAMNMIVGAEALVRWKKPDGTFNPPYMFIPLFEKDGLVAPLDEYMYRKVCELQKKWMDRGVGLIPISVNMSRTTLHQNDCVERYKRIIEETGVPAWSVPVEITESAAFSSIRFNELVERLKSMGFYLHMDDFGSGYSSLTSLGVLPFDVIKIDKSLTDTIGTERGEAIMRHMMEVIHELGMKVVVEGVEEESQVEYLKGLSCDAIQGYYYSKPVCQEEFEQMVGNYFNK